MQIKTNMGLSPALFKKQINRYTLLGLLIAIGSIIIATLLVAIQKTGTVDLSSIVLAQKTNPAIWALDITPFIFAYWGQSFFYSLVGSAESILETQAKEFKSLSNELETKLQYETHHDRLTNLPNRRLFTERIKQAIMQVTPEYKLAVIVLNINDFKNVNYMVGSYNANTILKQFGEKLKSTLLDPLILSCYSGINLIARLQGDEYGILLPRLLADTDIDEFMSNLIQLTSTYFMVDGMNVHVATSGGIALYPDHSNKAEDLIHFASMSTYHAQRNHMEFLVYEQTIQDEQANQRIMLNELRKAIDNQELEVFYQPHVDLNTGIIIGAEALIRLDSERFGFISAEKIIPMVENSEIIKTWTRFALKSAIQQLYLWHKQGHKIYVSVNISSIDAIDPNLPTYIQQLLDEKNLLPHFLRLELTERACLSNQSRSKPILDQLSNMGVKLIIEDFCSGYTSFIYLINFPIDGIKIDKSFTMNILQDKKKLLALKIMLSLADELGLESLAIGVSDEHILAKLKELNCRSGQGFYFSPAVNPIEFAALFHAELGVEAKVEGNVSH